MTIIEKKPIPIYEAKCNECLSVIRYQKSEVGFGGYIACPVCRCSVWAGTIRPVEMIDSEEDT